MYKNLKEKSNQAKNNQKEPIKQQNIVSQIHLQDINQSKNNQKDTKNNSNQLQNCLFCIRLKKYSSFQVLLNQALFKKYSSSQNYYFTKNIDDIINDVSAPLKIKYEDYQTLDESQEYLKRSYKQSEIYNKMKSLTEYYKYHKDIPRMFMDPTCIVINKFYEKKRYLDYVIIKKMLKLDVSQNGSEDYKKKKNNQKKDVEKPQKNLENFLLNNDLNSSDNMQKKNKNHQIRDLIKVLNNASQISNNISQQEMILYTEQSQSIINKSHLKSFINLNQENIYDVSEIIKPKLDQYIKIFEKNQPSYRIIKQNLYQPQPVVKQLEIKFMTQKLSKQEKQSPATERNTKLFQNYQNQKNNHQIQKNNQQINFQLEMAQIRSNSEKDLAFTQRQPTQSREKVSSSIRRLRKQKSQQLLIPNQFGGNSFKINLTENQQQLIPSQFTFQNNLIDQNTFCMKKQIESKQSYKIAAQNYIKAKKEIAQNGDQFVKSHYKSSSASNIILQQQKVSQPMQILQVYQQLNIGQIPNLQKINNTNNVRNSLINTKKEPQIQLQQEKNIKIITNLYNKSNSHSNDKGKIGQLIQYKASQPQYSGDTYRKMRQTYNQNMIFKKKI